jgi:hypothetical protein
MSLQSLHLQKLQLLNERGRASQVGAAPLHFRAGQLAADLDPDDWPLPASRDRFVAQPDAGDVPAISAEVDGPGATARRKHGARVHVRRPPLAKRTSKSRRRSGWFIAHSRIAR